MGFCARRLGRVSGWDAYRSAYPTLCLPPPPTCPISSLQLVMIRFPEKVAQHLDGIFAAVTNLDPGEVLVHGCAHFGKAIKTEGHRFNRKRYKHELKILTIGGKWSSPMPREFPVLCGAANERLVKGLSLGIGNGVREGPTRHFPTQTPPVIKPGKLGEGMCHHDVFNAGRFVASHSPFEIRRPRYSAWRPAWVIEAPRGPGKTRSGS